MEELSSSGEGQKDANACRSKPRRFKLDKEARIRNSSDYRRIMRRGVRSNTPHFHIRMLKNPVGITRLGIAVGRKAGNACARNRVKRRLREYFRLNREKMPPETDIVFVAQDGAATLSMHQLQDELDRFFEKRFCTRADTSSER
ncbi:MAG: ribonuclease P protein component [Desulfomonile tiedjei]|nr:ribonuclease P protein component [Desulfomonile tiedjei]